MPGPDASRIFDTLTAYWQTAALAAAIDLDLFTALGRRVRTARDIAAECGADPTALRTLCDSLVSMGFLRARRGRYRAAPDAARFLNAHSPDAMERRDGEEDQEEGQDRRLLVGRTGGGHVRPFEAT